MYWRWCDEKYHCSSSSSSIFDSKVQEDYINNPRYIIYYYVRIKHELLFKHTIKIKIQVYDFSFHPFFLPFASASASTTSSSKLMLIIISMWNWSNANVYGYIFRTFIFPLFCLSAFFYYWCNFCTVCTFYTEHTIPPTIYSLLFWMLLHIYPQNEMSLPYTLYMFIAYK